MDTRFDIVVDNLGANFYRRSTSCDLDVSAIERALLTPRGVLISDGIQDIMKDIRFSGPKLDSQL